MPRARCFRLYSMYVLLNQNLSVSLSCKSPNWCRQSYFSDLSQDGMTGIPDQGCSMLFGHVVTLKNKNAMSSFDDLGSGVWGLRSGVRGRGSGVCVWIHSFPDSNSSSSSLTFIYSRNVCSVVGYTAKLYGNRFVFKVSCSLQTN